ncbi:MAG TPA: glycosyltransferase [Casimicrobiaceae bacterium]
MTALAIALVSCAAWCYLLLARGGFWRARERDEKRDTQLVHRAAWPQVAAVIPARDEADVIGESVGSLLRQNYGNELSVIVVDDHSSDATAAEAVRAATAAGRASRLTVLSAPEVPAGWTGKLWAIDHGARHAGDVDYLLLTDADIRYAPDTLSRLAARADRDHLVLISLMARLNCTSFPERALIPAFVFFFQMLYPFAWVNQRARRTAAAAGGCMLVNRRALAAAGGIAAVRNELIDDCALARRLKGQGPIWLGLSERVESVRRYRSVGDIRRMIARTAYTQLGNSPVLLACAVVAMSLTFVAPIALVLASDGLPRLLGLLASCLMALAFQPMLSLYRVSPLWGLALPAIAAIYLTFTLDSAYQTARGRGGMWKGRVHRSSARG